MLEEQAAPEVVHSENLTDLAIDLIKSGHKAQNPALISAGCELMHIEEARRRVQRESAKEGDFKALVERFAPILEAHLKGRYSTHDETPARPTDEERRSMAQQLILETTNVHVARNLCLEAGKLRCVAELGTAPEGPLTRLGIHAVSVLSESDRKELLDRAAALEARALELLAELPDPDSVWFKNTSSGTLYA